MVSFQSLLWINGMRCLQEGIRDAFKKRFKKKDNYSSLNSNYISSFNDRRPTCLATELLNYLFFEKLRFYSLPKIYTASERETFQRSHEGHSKHMRNKEKLLQKTVEDHEQKTQTYSEQRHCLHQLWRNKQVDTGVVFIFKYWNCLIRSFLLSQLYLK